MELSGIRFLSDLDVEGRRVFCRLDLNVPLDGKRVRDDTRIVAALPTINALREGGAHVVLASHLGRPQGRDHALSLEPCAARLAELLDDDVVFADDCVGDGVDKVVTDLPQGKVAVLENLRFHKAEKANDPHFARLLAAPFQIYVNDAFGTCHRAHASMYGTVRHYTDCAAGFLVQSELDFLGRLLGKPAKPFVAVVGGAKVSDKIGVIRSLIGRCDTVLVGGAMAYTLLVSQGHEVGNSRVEPDKLDLAREILDLAASRRTRLLLPSDHIVAASIDAAKGKTTRGVDIPAGQSGFDIGPKTRAVFTDRLKSAGTVFWNGPVGVFEREPFREGTMAIARAIADSAAVSVVGGGDSAAAVRLAGLGDQIDHVSTGGGASLRFVEGGPLPGLEALRAGHRFEEE
jgi:phosphoglycerate kinase